MKSTVTLLALSAALASMAVAESWSGRLLDAACRQHSRTAACDATAATTSFAIEAGGRTLKFNTAGNQKAFAALKNRPDRGADPAQRAEKAGVIAIVTGTEENGVIEVGSVDIR